jgi:hypothetical protein
LSFRFGSDIGIVIVNNVSLAPAPVKIISVWVGSLANRQPKALKGNLVMPGTGAYPLALLSYPSSWILRFRMFYYLYYRAFRLGFQLGVN